MATESHLVRLLIDKYEASCRQNGVEATPGHINALESTISEMSRQLPEILGDSIDRKIDLDVLKEAGKDNHYSQYKNLVSILQLYAKKNDPEFKYGDLPNESHAMQLYEDTKKLAEATGNKNPLETSNPIFRALKEKVNIRGYTMEQFRLLETYLKKRGLISANANSANLYQAPVEVLELSEKPYKALQRGGIYEIGRLTNLTETELRRKCKSFPGPQMEELKKALAERGLSLKPTLRD